MWEIKPQNLCKNLWGAAAAGETPSLTGEFVGETYRVLEGTQNHPLRNQHQKGPICLWVAGEVIQSQQKAEHCSLLDPPTHTAPQHSEVGCPALVNT